MKRSIIAGAFAVILVIGGLIVAMYLPIFKMGDAISGGG